MNKVMIIAGETSGDLHGASLMKELKVLSPDLCFCGIGGEKMIDEGLDALYTTSEMAMIGFTEVVKHIPFIRKVRKNLLNLIERDKISHLVLIDYPGFNLNFAGKAKKLGVKISYYISPQIWAWGKKRVKKIKKFIDKMIVILPFEEEFYREHDVDVEYVGHPIVDRLNEYNYLTREELNKKFGLDERDILLLLPGSRKSEVEKIFPETITAAEKIAADNKIQVIVACSGGINENFFEQISPAKDYTVVSGYTYDLIRHAKFGIIKSGTSTLECAILGLPFVVIYKTSALTYLIGKMLVNISNIAMPNIIAGKEIVKEFIQNDVQADKIAEFVVRILSKDENLEEIKRKLKSVKEKIGENGAAKKAASIIFTEINESEKN